MNFAGFLKLILVCLSRTLVELWNRAAVLLAYLSLGVSLGVVVEEEGEGWTIASTAPSVLGSSPRRDGPSPPPPSHSPSPSTQRAAASLSPSNHFATPRHPHFFRFSHRCFWTQPRAIISTHGGRPCLISSRSFAHRIFDQVAETVMKSQTCASDYIILMQLSHLIHSPNLTQFNIKTIFSSL